MSSSRRDEYYTGEKTSPPIKNSTRPSEWNYSLPDPMNTWLYSYPFHSNKENSPSCELLFQIYFHFQPLNFKMAFLETSNLDTEIDILEQQQHFSELFGHPSSIIYDCYTTQESLAQKIDLILPQRNETERHELTKTIWKQNVYNGGNCLFMSPIYITLVLDHKPSPQVASQILSKSFQVHPVFRVQKCVRKFPDEINRDCCAVFIDETGRVYKNWTLFHKDNLYDDGLVVAPLNGIYNNSSDDKVKLEFFERKAGITRSLDRSSMVIGLASAGVAVMTFIPAITVAPVVAVGAAAAGLSCALYTGMRGIYNLYDRRKHKQTIKFTNPDARSSWINIAAGAFSASAASATQLVAKAAHNSTNVSNIIRSTAHALNAGALGLHTTGCLDDIYIMVTRMHGLEHITMVEISHLSGLLYLLTHSVKNHETAEKMLALSCELVDLKKILRESQKLAINALVHETMIVQGWSHNDKTGQITVRSLKNSIDSQPILMELDNEEYEGSEKTNARRESIKREYLEIFEARIASFVGRVLNRFKNRGENELKLFMINVMKEVSLHAFDDFMTVVESMIEKYGSEAESRSKSVLTFEHFAIMILKQLNVIGKDSDVTDLKEYLIGLSETERDKIDERIRDYFEHLKEEHVQDADELLASHINLSDDEKITLAIDGEVDKIVHKLQDLNIVYMKDDLRETVKDVLLSMPLAASHKFFDIVTKFMMKNGTEIQSRLGRFIPIDIFMTDIHNLLKKLSVSCGQELEHYLLDGEEIFEGIEKEIRQFYDSQLIVGNSNKCEHCPGFYYN